MCIRDSPNTVNDGGVEAAKLMLLIGKGEGQTSEGFDQRPAWEANLAIAREVTDDLNAQVDGLCRAAVSYTHLLFSAVFHTQFSQNRHALQR